MPKGFFIASRDVMFRTKEAKDRYDNAIKKMARQQILDAVVLTLAQEFGFGPGRFKKFHKGFDKTWIDICDLCNRDWDDDKDMTYSMAKIDELLKAAVGEENFVPFEERYS